MSSNPLPPNNNPTFAPDYPEAIVYPAHPDNYYRPENHNGVPNRPRGWVLHTPEEPADDNESTPRYFAEAPRGASTIYYLDSDGDAYQLVPERCAAIANGVLGKPYPSWADPRTSLNWQSLNVEIEGYAHSIHLTMPRGGKQWNGLLRLIRHRSAFYKLPLTRENIIGLASGAETIATIWGFVATAGTSGNVVLRWAQNSSSVNAVTVKAGSMLRATRVA